MTKPSGPTVIHLNTARGWRGGERQVLWLTERLNAAGVRSVVVSRSGEPLATRVQERGLPFAPLSPAGEWDLFAVWRLRRAMVRWRAGILHAHDGHAAALAALAVRGQKIDFVVTRRVHFRIGDTALSRRVYLQADAVIAVSRTVADVLRNCGIPKERITVVYSGVDLSRPVTPADPATLSRLGIRSGQPLVVMIAALVPHKDPLTFVRAMSAAREQVPELQALLIGDGPLRRSVETQIREQGLGDVVRLAGERPDADGLLATAQVAVLSSSGEGLGTVLLDALSWRIPVAATAPPAIREMIDDGVHGLLAPVGDAASLGRAVAQLLLDRSLAARLADAGAERVHQFSADRTAAETIAVYRRLPHAIPGW